MCAVLTLLHTIIHIITMLCCAKTVLKQLAEGLACMHLKPTPASYKQKYGFTCDGFLGAAPQSNEWEDNFVTFFLEQRLVPQYERAAEKFASNYGTSNVDSSALLTMSERVFDAARVALEPIAHAPPSLLHGGKLCMCSVSIAMYAYYTYE
jgi:fructosamine-3-kinase